MGGWFKNPRERRLWLSAGAWLLLVYASLYPVRPVATWLRERNLLRLTVVAVFLLAAALVLRWMVRRRASPREWRVAAIAAAAYLVALWPIPLPEERFHLIEYGVFGGLVFAAVCERRRPGEALRWSPVGAGVALAITGAAGWLDEGIQYLLPNRYYGLIDVGFNLLGGALAIGSLSALSWARR